MQFLDLPLELTLEQQFTFKTYQDQLKHMSAEQRHSTLLEAMRQIMIKENIIKHLMKKVM